MRRPLIALAVCLLCGCGKDQPAEKKPEPAKPAASAKTAETPEITLDEKTLQRIGLEVEQIRERRIPLHLRASGKLQENELRSPDISVLWMVIPFPPKDLARARLGMRAEITIGEEPYPAVVTRVDEAEVRLEVPNQDLKLKPGAEGEAEITVGESEPGMYLPEDEPQKMDGKVVAFVQKVPGRFEIRPITLGRTVEGYREVTGGLKPGETVVVAGSADLKAAAQSGRRAE